MPAAIAGYAVTAGLTTAGIGTAAVVGSITAAQIAGTIVSLAVSSVMADRERSKAEEGQRAASSASLRDVTMILDNPIVPRNMILGTARTSGLVWPWFTYGAYGENHLFAVTLAGHECDGFVSHMFNEDVLTLDGSGNVIAPAKYTRTNTVGTSDTIPGGSPGLTLKITNVPITPVSLYRYDPSVSNTDGGGQNSILPITNYTQSGDTFTILDDTTGVFVYASYSYVLITPLFRIREYLGAPGQAVAPELMEAAAASGNPGRWDVNRKNTGNCYVTIWMYADFNILGDIGVPKYSAVLRGAKPYDDRTGLRVWTDNPAPLAKWFLVDSPYSPKTLDSEVRASDVIASANVCDEFVQFSALAAARRYTCNGNLSSQEIPLSNLRHILDSMDGDALFVAGQWQLIAGYYRPPSLTFNSATLSEESLTIAPDASKDDLFNAIVGKYYSPAHSNQLVSYDQVTSTVYQAEDGDQLLPQPMDFVCVNEPIRCQMIAWQRLSRARNGQAIQLGTNFSGYDTTPLRNVTVDLPTVLGPVPKVFSVRRRTLNAPRLTYELQETGPEVWAWDYTKASAAVDIPDTSFPDILTVPVLTGITVSSGTADLLRLPNGSVVSRIRLAWDPVTNVNVLSGGAIRWRYRELINAAWTNATPVLGSDTEAFIYPVEDGKVYQIQGRCVTGTGREGDWCPAFTHKVIGKTERPPDILSFTINGNVLRWMPVEIADLAGYEIRFNYGKNTFWGAAAPLHDGLITNNPYTMLNRPSGTVTLMIKPIDMNGLDSVNPAFIVTDLGDPLVSNILIDYPEAPTFTGTITTGAVAGGVLQANATDLFFGDADQPFFGPDTDTFFQPGTYTPMVYAWDRTPEYAGRVLLQHNIVASAFSIEYRRGSQDAFFGDPADLFFGAPTDSFFGTPSAYATWPGALDIDGPESLGFRISTAGGATRGEVHVATVQIDVPDVTEKFNDLVISPAGTRLPITKTYRVIKNVNLTVQADGNGGISARIKNADKSATLGPLVEVVNKLEAAVTGLIDAEIQGY